MNDDSGRTIRLGDDRQLGYAEWGDPSGQPLLYFHGWPGSRIEGRLADQPAKAAGVRLIALDRPGMGLSSFKWHRTLLDWPDDVVQLAAALQLDRFAVLGISGGGPYAAACARMLSERLTGVGIVSSLAPLDVPGAVDGMSRRNRTSFKLVGRVPLLGRVLMARVGRSVRRSADAVLEAGVGPPGERYLDRPEVRRVLGESLTEAFRGGSSGPAWDLCLYARPWGFRVEDIKARVHLSHGEQDANAPINMGDTWQRPSRSVRPPSIRVRATSISSTASPRSLPPCAPQLLEQSNAHLGPPSDRADHGSCSAGTAGSSSSTSGPHPEVDRRRVCAG
jgi:pimeloyl-ACP methyl ester carboxylesterase